MMTTKFAKGLAARSLPLFLLIGIASYLIYHLEIRSEIDQIKIHELAHIEIHEQIVAGQTESTIKDLRFLTKQTQSILKSAKNNFDSKSALQRLYFNFCSQKKVYDQIRFIDKSGIEIVRVNFNDGHPKIIPQKQLQFKGQRYYFTDVIDLKPNDVYFSPFDLNIEHGKVEQPLKPMIRIGAIVKGADKKTSGIVLLNYLGNDLLNKIEDKNRDLLGQFMLMNKDGYWLKNPNPDLEWGFMFNEKKDLTFFNSFPLASSSIYHFKQGQLFNKKGLFTYSTIYPISTGIKSSFDSNKASVMIEHEMNPDQYYWKIVSFVPSDKIMRPLRKRLIITILITIFLFTMIFLISWRLTKASITLKDANLKLNELSKTDGLTKIANRRYFNEVLSLEYAKHIRSGKPLSLIMIDIDYFKKFNDHYGHIEGDKCLQQIADVLKKAAKRPSDFPARYGGEEFVCILPETDVVGAITVAEEIRKRIIDCAIFHEKSTVSDFVTASLGVASFKCSQDKSFEDIIKLADNQLYKAKNSGRNRVEAFSF